MNEPYEIRRSRRRTLSLEIREGRLIVRAPLRTSSERIDAFVREHARWIESRLTAARAREKEARALGVLTDGALRQLTEQAQKEFPLLVRLYAEKMGVTYGRITIRCQKTRWGSCSSRGDLSFNCLLMLAPPEVRESVVVHELAHRRHMNHSRLFYEEIARVFPEYPERNRWLKENGPVLQNRAPSR